MKIDNTYGVLDYKNSTELDDVAYFFFIQDFRSHNYYGYPELPEQTYFIGKYKNDNYGIKIYKKSKIYLNDIRKEKLVILSEI